MHRRQDGRAMLRIPLRPSMATGKASIRGQTSHNMDANLALLNHDSTELRGDDPRRETCPSGSVHDSLGNVRINRESACFCPCRVYRCRVDADVAASHVVAADHQAEPPQNLFLKQAPIMACRPANWPTLSCTSPHSYHSRPRTVPRWEKSLRTYRIGKPAATHHQSGQPLWFEPSLAVSSTPRRSNSHLRRLAQTRGCHALFRNGFSRTGSPVEPQSNPSLSYCHRHVHDRLIGRSLEARSTRTPSKSRKRGNEAGPRSIW